VPTNYDQGDPHQSKKLSSGKKINVEQPSVARSRDETLKRAKTVEEHHKKKGHTPIELRQLKRQIDFITPSIEPTPGLGRERMDVERKQCSRIGEQ